MLHDRALTLSYREHTAWLLDAAPVAESPLGGTVGCFGQPSDSAVRTGTRGSVVRAIPWSPKILTYYLAHVEVYGCRCVRRLVTFTGNPKSSNGVIENNVRM